MFLKDDESDKSEKVGTGRMMEKSRENNNVTKCPLSVGVVVLAGRFTAYS